MAASLEEPEVDLERKESGIGDAWKEKEVSGVHLRLERYGSFKYIIVLIHTNCFAIKYTLSFTFTLNKYI